MAEDEEQRQRRLLVEALMGRAQQPPNPFLGGIFGTPHPPAQRALTELLGRTPSTQPNPFSGLLSPGPLSPPKAKPTQVFLSKSRKIFFSFHYADIMRVNNVHNALKLQKDAEAAPFAFYDRSLWEKTKRTNAAGLKQLIREGMKHSSVLCVLIGSETWSRPWVRYEIARSVVDRRGLLAVDINGINHHQLRQPHMRGHNPLDYMAVGKMRDGIYKLFELRNNGWFQYGEYTLPVSLPRYLPEPPVGHVMALSSGTIRYDFAQQNGVKNLGGWATVAAGLADR